MDKPAQVAGQLAFENRVHADALTCLHFAAILVSQEDTAMPTLTLRDVSPELLSRLKEMARRNGRSMEQEVKLLLEQITSDRLEALRVIEATWTQREVTKEEADRCLADLWLE
jgi:plasmid stability protein